MKFKLFIKTICAVVFTFLFVSADGGGIGMFESSCDVGNPNLKGTVIYDASAGTYMLSGAGKNIWAESDQFFYVWRRARGNFSLSAKITFKGSGVNAHRKVGVMIRESLAGESRYADVAVHGDGLTSLQYRSETCRETKEVTAPANGDYVYLERAGNKIIMKTATGKYPEDVTGEIELNLPPSCYVGLYICSHEDDVLETAYFSRVEYKQLPSAPGRLTSILEVLDVTTGERSVVKEFPYQIEAANWTPDGQWLIYNSGGQLYKISPSSPGEPEWINTGFANRCNNDHVLTVDGQTIAISHGTREDGKSRAYVLPLEGGGTPRLLTPMAPSYLHGWSPDSRYLTYCGQRNGNFDVYIIPSEGGEEIRLTTDEGLDDGPEYSPSGEHIWFNSARSGLMQIWRMKANGSEQTQMTFDENSNAWFPHVSPDGQQVIFITYRKGDLNPDQHLANKNVELRLMPAAGGEPRTVAKLFGGQGTINVNSWAPDSKRLAFVSYRLDN
jgi:dipeptidyl aminopeptidase/acylaminoacyl peptidase